jgi:PAS domain S-box-containing protein
MGRDYERVPRSELIQRLSQLEANATQHQELERLFHELKVHQEEIELQNHQLSEMQIALEESRDRYADLYDFAPLGYCTLDGNGLIKEANLTLAQLLGIERGRLVGSHLLFYIKPGDRSRFLDYLLRCRSQKEQVSGEFHLKLRGNLEVPVQLTTTPPLSSRYEGSYRTMAINLSERQQAEDERRRLVLKEEAALATSQAKDRFLAMLSHELRTPLTPVLAIVSSFEELKGLPPQVKADIEMVRRNIEIEARLIDDLLDLTSITRGKLQLHREVVDLHEVVGHAVASIKEVVKEKDLSVEVELKAQHHHAAGDPSRLQQVLWNVLKNALKFTPRKGQISVKTWNPAPGVPPASVKSPPILIAVSDSGIGIAPQALPKVFRAFEQGNDQIAHEFGGLGLGLAISKGIVEGHGGRIAASSEGSGKGTTIEIELLTELEVEPRTAPAKIRASQQTAALRILLVEDHLDTANILSRLLALQGHQVTIAGSLKAALRQHGDGIDLLISDLGLPDGTGLELMRKLKEGSPRLAGIALSGFGTQEDVRHSLEAGFAEHLTKPVSLEKLLEAVSRVGSSAVA